MQLLSEVNSAQSSEILPNIQKEEKFDAASLHYIAGVRLPRIILPQTPPCVGVFSTGSVLLFRKKRRQLLKVTSSNLKHGSFDEAPDSYQNS
jgi:hypothetical protein